MSRRSPATARGLFFLTLTLLCGSVGCWEQWSESWFPQMKWQPSVQAFERPMHQGSVAQFMPVEGTVPIDGGEAPVSNVIDAASDGLVNPRTADLASLDNGREQYNTFCAPCHGDNGMGDGPVSMMGEINGPFGGVLPLVVAAGRSDGHIYTTIRYGRRRMPGYTRIPSEDRWDIVNYIRYLNKQQGVQ